MHSLVSCPPLPSRTEADNGKEISRRNEDTMKEKVTINGANYHRNGIGGIGFICLSISFKNDNRETVHAIATIETDDEKGAKYESCRIVNPVDVNDCYRGDVFGHGIADHIKGIETDKTKCFPFDMVFPQSFKIFN